MITLQRFIRKILHQLTSEDNAQESVSNCSLKILAEIRLTINLQRHSLKYGQ